MNQFYFLVEELLGLEWELYLIYRCVSAVSWSYGTNSWSFLVARTGFEYLCCDCAAVGILAPNGVDCIWWCHNVWVLASSLVSIHLGLVCQFCTSKACGVIFFFHMLCIDWYDSLIAL